MSPALLCLALDVAAIVCAALLGLRVLADGAKSPAARLLAAILACNICHIVLGRQEYGPWTDAAFRIDVGGWRPALNMARNLTPGLFMALSHLLFRDGRRFPRGLLALFALQLFLEEPIRWLAPVRPPWAEPVAGGLETLFAGAAIWWALESWGADLVESRRRLRVATVLVVGLQVIGASLLPRVLIAPDDPLNYPLHVALVAANGAVLAFLLLTYSPRDYALYLAPAERPGAAPPRPAGVAEAQATADLARLKALLETEHIYREPGLSLKALADRVGVPEYRLRRLIHEELGYRNFNLFLHHHRIAEACARLRDPAQRRTPILTIALSVGYQSVNTFNRGFAEVTGVTPSAYRARALAPAGDSQAETPPDPA